MRQRLRPCRAAANLGAGDVCQSRGSLPGLSIRRRVLGEDDPATALSYNNLAVCLNAGKYAEAEPFFYKALRTRLRKSEDDKPPTAISYNGLGSNLRAQGRYTEAGLRHSNRLIFVYARLVKITATQYSYSNIAHNPEHLGNTRAPRITAKSTGGLPAGSATGSSEHRTRYHQSCLQSPSATKECRGQTVPPKSP